MSADTYKNLSLKVLKMELQGRGLNVDGKKQDLVDRLLESDQERAAKGIVDEDEEDEELVQEIDVKTKEESEGEPEEKSSIKLELADDDKETSQTKDKSEEIKEIERDPDQLTQEEIKAHFDEEKRIPSEELQEVCQSLYDKHVKRDEGSTKTVLKAPVKNQIELKEFPHYHLSSKTFQGLIAEADTYQFKFYRNRGERGFGELAFSSIDKTVEIAKAMKQYESQFKDRSKKFQVRTFYGNYEEEKEVARKREEMEKERARRKEEEAKKKAEREAEKKVQEERMKDIEKARNALDARSLCVMNVPHNATKDIIREMFPEALRAELKTDADGKCKSHAYLEFDSEDIRDSCYSKYQGAVITDGEVKCEIVVRKLPLGGGKETFTESKKVEEKEKPKIPVRGIASKIGRGRGGRRGGIKGTNQPSSQRSWAQQEFSHNFANAPGILGVPPGNVGIKRPMSGGTGGGMGAKRGMRELRRGMR